jgi:hypothetical protein
MNADTLNRLAEVVEDGKRPFARECSCQDGEACFNPSGCDWNGCRGPAKCCPDCHGTGYMPVSEAEAVLRLFDLVGYILVGKTELGCYWAEVGEPQPQQPPLYPSLLEALAQAYLAVKGGAS